MSSPRFYVPPPAPLLPSDVQLVKDMNPTQKQLWRAPFEAWPEWAKRDAQLIANYRREFTTKPTHA